MKRGVFIALGLFAVGLAIYFGLRSPSPRPQSTPVNSTPPTNVIGSGSPSGEQRPATRLVGETILADYGNTNMPPENDLTLMSRLMENSLLLLKSAANQPLSANEDWAALLRGQNAAHERFIPEGHVALDAQGRLVDRWRVPLFFHALGGGRYELRSAGPDKKLWTADDLHRNADGSFRRGAELESPSLMEAAKKTPPGR